MTEQSKVGGVVDMSEFVAGDLVRLKSGGPMMVVISLNDEGHCACVWSVNNKDVSGVYPAVALISKQQVEQQQAVADKELSAKFARLGEALG
ncbi:DUF2158 domain-containing protein [Aeromonas veronii]|uniref:DUF2158 domain-containing protein n=1 Tax=Aeromonas veronii TaxID=654 RepID=UPI001F31AD0A|nr:hypothetical protein [Aeromonas veronii]MCF5898369.1 hypothetical protein [Aeromonas veronii]